MKKILLPAAFLLLFLTLGLINMHKFVYADWWQRPTEGPVITRTPFPTHRGGEEVEVTKTAPSPTNTVPKPTDKIPLPTSGIIPSVPIPTIENNGGIGGTESNEDLCENGKSFTGPYCGWSPDHDKSDSSSNNESTAVNSSPVVQGLSRTSGPELTLSDIMLFVGVLCLALYVKSKINPLQKNESKS
jgi:hypothetical protein